MGSEKSKRSIGKTFKNIPTGARISILIIGIFGLAAGFLTFNAFSSGDKSQDSLNLPSTGSSQVDLKASKVSGFKVGENNILGENSPMAEAERSARKKEIEEAKKSQGGGYMLPLQIGEDNKDTDSRSDFIDSLLADVDQRASKKLTSERNATRVKTGLDDVTDLERDEQVRQNRLRDMESELANSEAKRNGQNVIYNTKKVRIYQTGSISMEGVVPSENARASRISQKVLSQASRIAGGDTYAFAGGGTSGGSTGSSGMVEGASDRYNPANDPNNQAFYDPYVNNDRHIVKPDYEGLTNTRNQVMAAMGSNAYGSQGANQNTGGNQASGRDYQFSSEGLTQDTYDSGGEYGYSPQRNGNSLGQDQASNKPYKAIGDVCYGKLKMNIDSDVPTPVRVQFLDRRCNKLFNAIAVAQPALTGEHITLDFKGIKLNGRTQSLSAMALDPESKTALFQDDLNRHIFSRYVSLAAAAALPGWSDAVVGVDIEEDENGNERRRQQPVDALSDQLAVIAGSIGSAITPILQQNFQRPPTVKVHNNRDILIMFMGDFYIQP